jgi:hypothetical protein
MRPFAIGVEHPIDVPVQTFLTPIFAIRGSPPRLHSISTSIAVCHSGSTDSVFGSPVM